MWLVGRKFLSKIWRCSGFVEENRSNIAKETTDPGIPLSDQMPLISTRCAHCVTLRYNSNINKSNQNSYCVEIITTFKNHTIQDTTTGLSDKVKQWWDLGQKKIPIKALLTFSWFSMLLFDIIGSFGMSSPKKARPHFDDALCHVCIVIPTSHVVIMR